MLDTDTKRRIDTARDILVGKVPDPKSQVEQITIALIYKFMDDMDAEAEELGGKRKFFTGEFARYGWARLMRSGLGGHELLGLYAEGITRMPQNPGIPLLFREIFKNAYLPYRDPETLKAFLKIIDEFTYDHSERLGDAFEYLLSVLGSQGDAGQFRTPRHIIDFMVEIVAPQKGETILDPACGTAGFLISAWKHILRANTDAAGHSRLTPDDRGRLARNIQGYDISPDMVRLSLVNLYLHGFTDPHIYEYDTLTSEERWNETADVILANPPFMSPKGGIKPHRRFSIQAKRSEVLFVDYIAEHLTPTGRAGIIVPEGIIFQSQTAYKEMRKSLVENSLVAVISLPAGCFNPYSGVKTSILILDKSLARQSETIAFFKIGNDGFGLGAQRRAIEGEQLTQARIELSAYLRSLRSGDATLSPAGLIVTKENISANGDYNLSGERYREVHKSFSEFPHVTLHEVCEINSTNASPRELYPNSHFNYIDISCVENESGKFLGGNKTAAEDAPSRARRSLQNGDILMSTVRPNLKAFAFITEVPDRAIASTGFAVLRARPERILPGYLIHVLRDDRSVAQMIGMAGKGAYPSINQTDVESVKIPLPPLEVQKEVVAEIEAYQRVINGARAVLDHYRPHIPIHPDWPKRLLIELAKNLDSRRVPITKGDRKEGQYPYYGASGVVDHVAGFIFDEDILLISEDGANLLARSTPIAFSVCGKCWVNNHAHVLRFTSKATQTFVETYLNSISVAEFVTGAAQPKLNQEALNSIPIPIPDDLATQRAIVAEIEAEQALVGANRELIVRFEKKIEATLARVWGEEALAPDTSATTTPSDETEEEPALLVAEAAVESV